MEKWIFNIIKIIIFEIRTFINEFLALKKNIKLKLSGLEDNVNTSLRAGKNDVKHKSMNKLRTPKMLTNSYAHLSIVTSDTPCLQKW